MHYMHVNSLIALWWWWSLDSFHGELTAGLIGTLLFYVASKTFPHLEVGSPCQTVDGKMMAKLLPTHIHDLFLYCMQGRLLL